VAGDVGAHMPPERMLKWASAYVMVPGLSDDQQKEANGLHELLRSRYRQGVLERKDAIRLGDVFDNLGVANVALTGESLGLLVAAADMGLRVPPRAQDLCWPRRGPNTAPARRGQTWTPPTPSPTRCRASRRWAMSAR
jgi:hypothetical protein